MIGQRQLWKAVAAAALALPLAAACGDTTEDDDGTGGSSTSSTTSSGQGGTTSSGTGGSSSGTGGGVATISVCQHTCASPADCSNGLAAYDEDNYACPDGWCQYLGCNNDTECAALGNQVCRDIGVGIDSCVAACGVPAQCDQGSAPYDEDNYACSDGWCQYQGCNGDTECATLGNYLCRDLGFGTTSCVMACTVPEDCNIGGGPAYDADNYTCNDGWCQYTGCNNDGECQAIGDYVCR
jgi:hypothetical protein